MGYLLALTGMLYENCFFAMDNPGSTTSLAADIPFDGGDPSDVLFRELQYRVEEPEFRRKWGSERSIVGIVAAARERWPCPAD